MLDYGIDPNDAYINTTMVLTLIEALQSPHRNHHKANGIISPSITSFQCFPLSNFKYFLTLFSKFFSSFPRGTCSLSVSRIYLALEGIYLPFRAAIPNNPTLRTEIVRASSQTIYGDLTLYVALFQRTYA